MTAQSEPHPQQVQMAATSLASLCGAPMEPGPFLELATLVCQAVADMHRQHVVHQNLTPADIFIDPATRTVTLGALPGASSGPRQEPSADVVSGSNRKLAYISPERTGRMNRIVDHRSDLYSLGVIFYEMVTGTLPFEAEDELGWVHCHLARAARPPVEMIPSIPPMVSDVVMRLLAKIPEERYQTAAGLKADLERCLSSWKAGRAERFPLGQHDIPDQLLISQALYGRGKELKSLLDTFDRVAAQGTPEMAVVAGYSGIGKSSLVRELCQPAVRARGAFISGKFDQYKRGIPYFTIGEAFHEPILRILTESVESIARWQNRFREALGANAQLIVDVIPQFELVVGKQPPVAELPPAEARNRFNLVFRRFLSVFSSKEHPLILFLDDLQWGDSASLLLLEDLMTCGETSHFLLIGAYRDNEVAPTHPLMLALDAIRASGTRVETITLAPLFPCDVSRLLADTLRTRPESVQPLSALVHRKTAGNPFFIVHFAKALYADGLLEFDAEKGCWCWDVGRIEAQGFTDNVADLVMTKLGRLHPATREILRLASCIGSRFDLETLMAIVEGGEEEMLAGLWEAIQEGVVLSGPSYSFVHDCIQQAAYSLIPEEDRQKVHLRIGRLMVQRFDQAEIEERIFEVAHQLNVGGALIEEREERYRVAELNLMAGRKAKGSTAYASALGYLSAGVKLLDERVWEENYPLAFDLFHELAVVEFLNSNYGRSKELIDFLLPRAHSELERARLHNVLIVQYTLTADYAAAIRTGREALRPLGIVVPESDIAEALNRLLAENLALIGKGEIATLLDDPAMTDPAMMVALELLSNMVVPARYSDSTLFALVVVLNVNVSLRFGLTPKSTVGYTAFGMVLNSMKGEYRDALEFGELSLALSERFNAPAQKCQACFMIGHYLNHWVRHLKWADAILEEGIEAGLGSGEMQWTGYSFAYKLFQPFYRGVPLGRIREEIPGLLQFTRKTRNHWATDTLLGLDLAASELNDSCGPPLCRDEEQFFADSRSHRSFGAKGRFAVLKGQILFLLGREREALDVLTKAEELEGFYSSSISVAERNFYHSLTLAALCEGVSESDRELSLAEIGKNQRRMKSWAESCPANFRHLHLLVEAELARLSGRELDAEGLYEEAIASASEGGFVQDEGLSCELASRFHRRRGFATISDAYLWKAHDCYLRWGGTGKVRQLEREWPQCARSNHPGGASYIGVIDAVAVVKASQAISGNLRFQDLIDSLLRIVLQHAGAERGTLLLCGAEAVRVAATAVVSGDTISVRQEGGELDPEELPVSLVNYVQRTGESVILDDAADSTLFAEDGCLARRKSRSVFCLPIKRQSMPVGLLYLENNLVPGAFTPDRTAVLELLASQAAISLENALLDEERSRAEAALRSSEERYRAIFEHCGTALIFIEDDATVSMFNREFEKLYEADRWELEGGFRWTELVAREDDLRRMLEYHQLRRIRPAAAPQTYEFRMVTRKGALRDIVTSVTTLPGTRQSMATLLDVTERKWAVAALREKAEQIQLLMNSTGEGIYGVDLDGLCTFINLAALKALGYDNPSQFLGLGIHELIHHTRSDGTPYPASECRMYQACRDGVPTTVTDEVFWRRDGSSFFVEYASHPIIQGDAVVGAVCTFHDVTQRREAEEKITRLATIIEQAAEGIILTDTSWVIQYANPAFETITGYGRNEIVGMHTSVLKSDAHDRDFYRNIRETMQRGEVWSGRLVNTRKDGSAYEVDATGSPVRDESGKVINYIGIQHDITNEIRLERQLRQAQKMEAIGTLAGGIAHDFNNILTAIIGYSHLLSMKLPSDSPLRSPLEQILGASLRATDLVKQILAFSRQGDNKKKPVLISLIVKEVLKLIRSSLPTTIEIRQEVSVATGEDVVLADGTQMHQVLMNLATNAAHAMRAHGGQLAIRLEPFLVEAPLDTSPPGLRAGAYVKLVVSDTGHGMDQATQERIFDPYFTTKAAGEGTGLGLAVVQGIVQSHGGSISVYSVPGKGTSFTVFLPRIKSQAQEESEKEQQLPTGSERILFVDDEDPLARLGREILGALGYRVTAKTGSRQALRAFRAHPDLFDLVVTDMTMPGLTGEELSRELLAIRPDIPVILYTGYIEEGLLQRAEEVGIYRVVMKPYDVAHMATLIRNVLDGVKPEQPDAPIPP